LLAVLVWPGRAIAVTIVIVLAFIAMAAGIAFDFRGLGQRAFLYTAFIWMAIVARRLIRSPA
jgi:hypothetical protein